MSNGSGNATASVPADPLAISYACVGTVAILTNGVIFAVVFTNKKLLVQSALVIGFACCHSLLALYIGISGIMRTVYRNALTEPMSPMECLQLVYPIAYPLAFQSSALFLIMVGIERLAAVAAPHWFRRWLSGKCTWRLVGLVFVLVCCSVAIGISQVQYLPPTTRQCGQPTVFGSAFTAFGRLASACGGTVAVVLTIAALVVGARRIRKLPLASGEAGKIRRQIQLTKAMLGVAFIDFCLVVIPNTVSFMAAATGVALPSYMGALQSNVAFCVNATSSIFPYLIFNNQFRRTALALFCLGASAASVGTVAGSVGYGSQARSATERSTAWKSKQTRD